jgi:hypothetical protein
VSPYRSNQRHVASIAVAASLLAGGPLLAACGGDDDAQRVVPADESVAGKTLTDLVADWTRNVHETPLDESFLMDPSKCDMGGSTDEVYLAPTWTDGETAATCTVREGQAVLLVPVAILLVDDQEEGFEPGELESGWNLTSALLTLDGEAIELAQRQVDTPVITVDLPEGNIWEAPVGEFEAATRAQAVVIENLSVGTHEVVLAGEFGDGEFGGTMTLTLVVEG